MLEGCAVARTSGGHGASMKKAATRHESTAYHEAGHAIVTWRLGRKVSRVSIVPGKGFLGMAGHVRFLSKADLRNIEVGDIPPLTQRRMENQMVVLLAGQAAQRRYNPRSVRNYHSRDDRDLAFEVLGHLTGIPDTAGAYYRLMKLRARDIVSANWRAIDILAQELLQRRTLSAKELRAFIVSDCFAVPQFNV
jgi:ATP-dependent Zn protease